MPRLSMNELTTFRWSFDEDVHHYQQAGFEAIGVWRRKLADFGEERAIELLVDTGMNVSNLLWAGGFTGNDGRPLRESIDDAKAAIRTAAILRAGSLVLYTGGRNNHTQRHAQRLVRGVLEELIPPAEEYGVTLAIEPMHPACGGDWTILSSLEETLDFIAQLNSRRVKMVYDSYHFPLGTMAEHGGMALLSDLAPLLAVVHLGDWRLPHGVDQQRCPLGQGHAPLEEIVAALLDGGFQGYFDVELIGAAAEPADYEQLVRQSHARLSAIVSSAGVVGR